MEIFIAGLTGTGKSTLAKNISLNLDIKYYESSKMFREFLGKETDSIGFWTTKEGIELSENRKNMDLDEKFDSYLKDFVEDKSNFIIDSWTMPWLSQKKALRIFLKAPIEVRAKRVMSRNDNSYTEALELVKLKDESTMTLYKNKYGFDIFNDWNIFDLIVDTSNLDIPNLNNFICNFVKLSQKNNKSF